MNLSIAESVSAIRAAAGFVAWDPDTFAIICLWELGEMLHFLSN